MAETSTGNQAADDALRELLGAFLQHESESDEEFKARVRKELDRIIDAQALRGGGNDAEYCGFVSGADWMFERFQRFVDERTVARTTIDKKRYRIVEDWNGAA